MSLHIPPMYEMVPVFREDGQQIGHVLRVVRLAPGEVLIPLGGNVERNWRDGVAMIQEASDAARYD